MVESLTIRGFQGIREGVIEDFSPLTVITGVNGCGKSTVLDALLVTHSQKPSVALGRAALRRHDTPDPIRWLLHRGLEEAVLIVTDADETRSYDIRLVVYDARNKELQVRTGLGVSANERKPSGLVGGMDQAIQLPAPGDYVEVDAVAELLDPSVPTSVVDNYSEAIREGRRADITDVLSELIPGFEALEILADGGQSSLYITKRGEGAIPLSVSGDGIRALVQMAVSLATISDGLALIEEPEVFQHPGALRQTARVLWANVRRGVQVVLTTHSLDFIDALVETATEEDLPKLAVLTLALDDGMLRCSRVAGEDVRFARATMETDLR